jgi:hypothetical protein
VNSIGAKANKTGKREENQQRGGSSGRMVKSIRQWPSVSLFTDPASSEAGPTSDSRSIDGRGKAWLEEHKQFVWALLKLRPYSLSRGSIWGGLQSLFRHRRSARNHHGNGGGSMTEMVEGVKKRTLDIITTIRKTPEREEFMNLTQSYIPTQLIIVTRKDYSEIKRRDDLGGKKIALVKDWSVSKKVVEQFPTVEPSWVSEPLKLSDISTGQADVTWARKELHTLSPRTHNETKMASVFEEA